MQFTDQMIELGKLYEAAQECEFNEWSKLNKAGCQNEDGSWKEFADTSMWKHWNTRANYYAEKLHILLPSDDDFFSLIYLVTTSE